MKNDRTTPGTGFWVTVAVIAVLAYPASLGPCSWASSRTGIGVSVVQFIYGPILRAAEACSMRAVDFFEAYSRVGAAPGWEWIKFPNASGTGAAWHWMQIRWPPVRRSSIGSASGPSVGSEAEEQEPSASVPE